MFKKLSASLGIGSAHVDTILQNPSISQGKTVQGFIHIKGGLVEQKIDAIILKLCTEVKVESDSGTHYQPLILNSFNVNAPFMIQSGEIKDVPFEFTLHNETPITAINTSLNRCKVWIETTLDIDFAINPNDRDYLDIQPLLSVQRVIHYLEQEGFFMLKADVEKGYLKGDHFRSVSGCYQELEFQNRALLNRKEIELSFILDDDVIHCLVEIDRAFSQKDTYREFTLSLEASESDVERAFLSILHA